MREYFDIEWDNLEQGDVICGFLPSADQPFACYEIESVDHGAIYFAQKVLCKKYVKVPHSLSIREIQQGVKHVTFGDHENPDAIVSFKKGVGEYEG
jgi:hypothetical protein